MTTVRVTIYTWAGRFGPLRIHSKCGECSLSTRVIRDVIEEFGDRVEYTELPWLDNWHRALWRGGWHPPIVLVDGKLLSQGVVLDRDVLRGTIVRRLYRDYAVPDGVQLFGLPGCIHCARAKKLLERRGVQYVEHDVLASNDELQKLLALVQGKLHPITVPQIVKASIGVARNEPADRSC